MHVARDAYLGEWQKVREENAALRVLTSQGLVSATIDHFDNMILSCITGEWQRCGHVVIESLAKQREGDFRQLSSDMFLFVRLLDLIDDEVVEGKTEQESWSMRESWVRLGPRALQRRN